MDDENVLDFNFWPSFADLMLALVFILVLILFFVIGVITAGTVNLSQVKENQMKMINVIADDYRVTPEKISEDNIISIYSISTNGGGIKIQSTPELQKITFGSDLLFRKDKYILDPEKEKFLGSIGKAIKNNLSLIKEIQIQGHADIDRKESTDDLYNVNLAANRAIQVYNYLWKKVGIEPAKHLMSVTSFGEFKPVNRLDDDKTYNQESLEKDNTVELKKQNRRIEVLLFYRL
jgi:flagellar motor protein MotB